MSEPVALNKTESRVTALKEVSAGRVDYDPTTGEYFVTSEGSREVVRGARRRTFAELRSDEVIEPDNLSTRGPVRLTSDGISLFKDWGLAKEID